MIVMPFRLDLTERMPPDWYAEQWPAGDAEAKRESRRQEQVRRNWHPVADD